MITFPETNICAPENQWLEDDFAFLDPFAPFAGANLLLVSGQGIICQEFLPRAPLMVTYRDYNHSYPLIRPITGILTPFITIGSGPVL